MRQQDRRVLLEGLPPTQLKLFGLQEVLGDDWLKALKLES
jgi:hypothetical protein